jgi:hypothetical protein
MLSTGKQGIFLTLPNVCEHGLQVRGGKPRIVLQQLALRPALSKSLDNEFHRDSRALNGRLAAQNRRISNDAILPVYMVYDIFGSVNAPSSCSLSDFLVASSPVPGQVLGGAGTALEKSGMLGQGKACRGLDDDRVLVEPASLVDDLG